MEKVDEYYEKTMSNKTSKLLQKFWNMKLNEEISQKNAIDLGCGVGNDVIFLLNNGFRVTAIDKEKKVIDIIKSRIENLSNLDFIIEDFEKVKLCRNNLVLSNFSLFFCEPQYFDKFIKEVTNSINHNGYFVRKFSG